jgi:hypothetical protein
MSGEPEYETQSIDHLGIVAGISREIGLVETIDAKIDHTNRKVSCGEAVLAMVLNALGFTSRALYLMPDYLRNKPVVIDGRVMTRKILNLRPVHLQILGLLGPQVQTCYLIKT